MLRLTEIKLPLTHSEHELNAAILKRLDIVADELIGYTIFRRGFDARKPSAIMFIYTLDVEVQNEAALLKRLKNTQHLHRGRAVLKDTVGGAKRQLPQSAGSDSNVSLPHITPAPDTSYHFVAHAPKTFTERPV